MIFNQSVCAYAYPLRYSKITFDKLHDMLKNDELHRDYIMRKSGINYKTTWKIETDEFNSKLNNEVISSL